MRKQSFKKYFTPLFSIAILLSVFLLPNSAFAAVSCVRNYEAGRPLECEETSQRLCQDQCAVKDSGATCYIDETSASCAEWNQNRDQKNAETAKVQAALKKEQAAKKAEHDRIAAENIANGPVCRCKLADPDALPEVIEGIQTQQGCDGLSNEFKAQHTYTECVLERRGEEAVQAAREEQQIEKANQAASVQTKFEVDKSNPIPKNLQTEFDALNRIKGGPDGADSLQGLIGLAIKTAMGILGTIALSMIIYGGFLWMTAMGNASQSEKALNIIFWAALGIFVIFGSYAIVTFIFEATNTTLNTK